MQARLAHIPVSFFSVVMGLMGLALALHAGERFLPFADIAAGAVFWAGLGSAAVIGFLYLFKTMRHPAAVRDEWRHPVTLAFFPTLTIALLLIATALLPRAPALAEPLWIAGAAGQGVLTLAVVSGWISHRGFEVGHLTPAWFIPALGNVLVPVAGAEMGYIETSWAFFAVGVAFWGLLLALVMNRLIFHDPIPARLFPTMLILVAPPALAFVAYVKMTGGVIDGFARTLLYTGYFFALLVLVQLPRLARIPFAVSWWVLSFPIAALAIASFLFARIEQTAFHRWAGLVLLAVLVLAVAALTVRTLAGILRGEAFRPD